MRRLRPFALALFLSAPALAASAQTGAAPGDGAPAPLRPTSAVGVLHKTGDAGGCTGTMIRDDLVLTAAHCVRGVENPDILVFRTGAYPGIVPVEVRGAEIYWHPLYEPDQQDLSLRTGFDLAFVHLSEPVPAAAALPLPVSEEPVSDARILLASWRGAAGERARERTCPRVSSTPLLIVMACDVRQGESGSPLLRRSGDGLEIVGVLAARSGEGPGKWAYAAGASRIGQLFAIAGPALAEP